jgi:hypothetical protein
VKFVSALATAVSGKIRGIVGSHNKGGQYLRGKTIPVNRNTPTQVAQRARLKLSVGVYSTSLTDAQRLSFAVYAQNVTTVDSLGNTIKLSGQNWYIDQSTTRQQAGLSPINTCSSNFTLTTITPFTATATASATNLTVAINPSDEWATSSNGALLVFASRPQNSGKAYFTGPYQLAGVIHGGTSAISSTNLLSLPFPTGTAGSQIFLRARATAGDGRTSASFRLPVKV